MNIEDYGKSCIDNYKKFMCIEEFPKFTVKSKEIILEKSKNQGFDAVQEEKLKRSNVATDESGTHRSSTKYSSVRK